MRIKDMFAKDIDREINGVVKVAQEDDAAIRQELEEYVVTRELKRRFGDFFAAYEAALDRPTEKTGVWISGFFGSGKSHFLKMLSYLLENKVVDGKPAIDYFIDPKTGESKFGDPFMDAKVRRCVSVPTETILFNIDNKGPSEKDKTAILKVFARVFYEHLGYYGEDLKLARLERYIDDQGKQEEFSAAFERINGGTWLDERETYDFNSDDVIEALTEAGVMSQAEAERWFEGTEIEEFSVDKLTNQIRDYADRRAREEGGTFRLIFCVDEVGQYIGDDPDLMLNLQTIVEDLGTKCAGRVWVMVTSQEAIDQVTKVAGNDFSKIQGRFDTRLSLSSSSVDEVIKRRVLEKTDTARQTLSLVYEQQSAVLRNLFTFEDARGDLAGFASADEFVESYPFVGYQFHLMQSIFTQIRKHGSSGKHLSSGERSMLSGFQEAAQRVEDLDEHALVPLPLFYDTLSTFLEGAVRRVIDRASEAASAGAGLEPQDVDVLKLLFLVLHVDEVKANVDNIAILLVDRIDVDKIALRERVVASLDRLVRQNYISRTGDVYSFLNDEEQDIAREIRETPVDTTRLIQKIASVVFEDVYTEKKYRMGSGETANDFPIDRFVDDAPVSQLQNGLKFTVITELSGYSLDDYQQFTMRSHAPEALAVLRDNGYLEALEEAARIDAYLRTKNVSALPPTVQAIIENRRKEMRSLERKAADLLKTAIADADFYVSGSSFKPRGSGAHNCIDEVLGQLVGSVYDKLSYIDHNVRDDAEIISIATGRAQTFDGLEPNRRAMKDVLDYLQSQQLRGFSVSMKDVQMRYGSKPYGWREADVAGVVAALVAGQQAQIRYNGAIVPPTSRSFAEYLRQRNKVASVKVEQRVAVSQEQRAKAQTILREVFRGENIPVDEDGLCKVAASLLGRLRDDLKDLLAREYQRGGSVARKAYPGGMTVEHGIKLCDALLAKAGDPALFITAIREAEDDLLDFAEDYEDVDGFFNGSQRAQFDRAVAMLALMDASERGYFTRVEGVPEALATIEEIIGLDEPYRRLRELPSCLDTIEHAHHERLEAERRSRLDDIERTFDEVQKAAEEGGVSLPNAGTRHSSFKANAHGAKSLTQLDALTHQLDAYRARAYRTIEELVRAKEEEERRPKPTAPGTVVVTHGNTGGAPAQPAAKPAEPVKKPKPKDVRLSTLCRPRTLESQADVDAYVEALRTRLTAELERNADGIFVN